MTEMRRHYRIYAIDGQKLAEAVSRQDYVYEINDAHARILDHKQPILRQNENALFRQIILQCGLAGDDEDCLLKKIVEVDFSRIFDSTAALQQKEPFLKDLFDGNKDGKKGFVLNFADEENVRFVPFDFSGNMLRHNKLTFVDERIRDDLDERLLLGFPFAEMQIDVSKYFTYRGLYLSNGVRIEHRNDRDGFVLNEESVIVIDDLNQPKKNAKDQNLSAGIYTNETKAEEDKPYGFVRKDLSEISKEIENNKSINVNSFDGEGLISPEYSEYISRKLQQIAYLRKDENAHSFQIRLPFIKGVLHEVDFKRFFKEELGLDDTKIIDYFGIERDLSKAHIILTLSMFKAGKWLKWLTGAEHIIKEDFQKFDRNAKELYPDLSWQDDVMKYYFRQLDKYQHHLYICSTDVSFHNSGRIKLNYQFISTLDLSKDEFRKLLDDNLDYVVNIEQEFFNDFNEDEDDTEEVPDPIELSTWQLALKMNRAFIRDKYISDQINDKRKSAQQKTVFGNIPVAGENRYLSGDLLSFLMHLYKKSADYDEGKRQAIVYYCLRDNSFFIAGSTYQDIRTNGNYVLLRNPHLSRNEEVVAIAYLGDDQKNPYFLKYFSQLKGVVMISYQSMIPNALGGADFDGDPVKIIYDQRIIDAAKRSAYQTYDYVNRKGKKKKVFERKLPIVLISSLKAEGNNTVDRTKGISFRQVRNTFSNNIGLISNLAVKFSQLDTEANRNSSSENVREAMADLGDKCAECTIVTGLDIDAAKHGKHPLDNIEKLKDEYDKKSAVINAATPDKSIGGSANNYLSLKNELKKGKVVEVSTDKKTGVSVLKVGNSKIEIIPGHTPNNLTALLDNYIEISDANKNKKQNASKERLFVFEEDKWEEKLDADKKKQIRKLMDAYVECISQFNGKRNSKQKNDWSDFESRGLMEFKQIYGSLKYMLDENHNIRSAYDLSKDLIWKYADEAFAEAFPDQGADQQTKEERLWYATSDMENVEKFYDAFGKLLSADQSDEAACVRKLLYRKEYKEKEKTMLFILRYMILYLIRDYLQEIKQAKQPEPDNEISAPELAEVLKTADEEALGLNRFYDLLNQRAYEVLSGMINDDEALKYIYSISKKSGKKGYSRFIWEVLPGDVVLENVYCPDGGNSDVE